MKKAILVYADDNYAKQLAVMKKSVERYGMEFDLVVEYNVSPMILMTVQRQDKILSLFDQGYDQVVFSGADQVFFNEISFIDYVDCILFPHCNEPPPLDGRRTNINDLLRTGTFNADLQVWNNTPQSRKFLSWLSEELKRECVSDVGRGLFFDQTYYNLVPAFISDVCIDRSSVHNVAFYNLHHNEITQDSDGRWLVNHLPLRSFHFTGFDINNPAKISRHQNRFTATGALLELMEWYATALRL